MVNDWTHIAARWYREQQVLAEARQVIDQEGFRFEAEGLMIDEINEVLTGAVREWAAERMDALRGVISSVRERLCDLWTHLCEAFRRVGSQFRQLSAVFQQVEETRREVKAPKPSERCRGPGGFR